MDVMPHIGDDELPPGCPLRLADGSAAIYLGVCDNDEGITVAWNADDIESGVDPNEACVDLSTANGFGYALTKVERPIRWVSNWMNGKTTDADRLAVAHALAEAS